MSMTRELKPKTKRPWFSRVDLVGRLLQAVFSLKMIGSMFIMWMVINVAGCQNPPRLVPFTGWQLVGRGEYQILLFPLLGTLFLLTALAKPRRVPLDYSLFTASAKVITVNVLFWVLVWTALRISIREGPGLHLALLGICGIGVLGVIRLLRHSSSTFRSAHLLSGPGRPGSRALRFIGVVDFAIAFLVSAGMVLLGIDRYGNDPSKVSLKTLYPCIMCVVFACCAWSMGQGIRRREGWAAMAHVMLSRGMYV